MCPEGEKHKAHVRTDRTLVAFSLANHPDMRTSTPLLCILLGLLFAALFHNAGLGINLPLFQVVLLIAAWAVERPSLRPELLLAVGGTIISGIAVALHGSLLAIWVNLLSALLFTGLLLAPKLRALHHMFLLSMAHVLPAQRAFLRTINERLRARGLPVLRGRALLAVALIAGTAWLFAMLYRAANPHFEALADRITNKLGIWLAGLDLSIAGTFLLGLTLTNVVMLRTTQRGMLGWMSAANDQLFRRPQAPASSMLGLRYEARMGIALLAVLNVLLLVANVLDIRHVWFGFTFNGQYLKQFVHEGTWLLILSIALGAAVVLWFFRANQNFHRGNGLLRSLAYVWLAQNALLAVSVAIRNSWYIHHYALAYKRIGVLFFLLAVIAGLVLVLLKVRRRRSAHYLLRTNALSVYVILLGMCCVDWSMLIARYNFGKRDQAFVHLDFMATLPDRTLPWLVQEQHALEKIDRNNQDLLSGSFSRSLYMEPSTYGSIIAMRIERFMQEYPDRSWREWRHADARAYRLLTQQVRGAAKPL